MAIQPITSFISDDQDNAKQIVYGQSDYGNKTQLEIDALTPVTGSKVFNTTLGVQQQYNGTIWIENGTQEQNEVTKEPTGYPNRLDTTFSFDDVTRTFTIQPTGISFDIWSQGSKLTITTPKTLVLPNTTGKYFIFFDNTATLGYSLSFSDSLLNDKIFTSTVYYNATTGKGEFLVDERHGLTMDWATHFHLHNAFGTRYYGGFGLSYINGDGSLDTHGQIVMGGGTIADEDIPTTITDSLTPSNFFEQTLSPIAQIPVIYKLGNSEWQKDASNNFPIKDGGGLFYSLNTLGVYSLAAVSNNNYIAVWIFATPEVNTPIISILGNREDSSLNDAKNNNTYDSIEWGDLPSQEYKILYRIIYEHKNTYGNSIQARIVDVLDLRGSIDGTLSSGNFTPVASHGSLIGLSADDHTQYHTDARGDVRYYTKSQSDLNYEPINSNIQSHIFSTSNPHSVTKTQVGLSNVVNLDTSTTSNITDSINKRFVTDAQQVVIGNTSNTNTGDNSVNTLYNGLVTAYIITTSNVTTTLTSSDSNNVVLSGTNQNQILSLGDATTYLVGKPIIIKSNNTEVVNIVNNSLTELARLEPYNTITFTLLNNSTANGIWIQTVTFAPSDKGYNYREEFNTGSTAGQSNWTNTASGAGAGTTTASTLFGRKSLYQLSTGTTNAGRIAFNKSSNGTLFGNGIMFCYETQIYIPTLSIAADRYLLTVGYGDNIVAGDHLDGVYFEYDESLNTTWRLKTANNGTRTTTVTAVTVTAGSWIKLRMEVNRNGSEVLYFINNQFVGNITTNIPTGAGRNTDLLYKITKSAGATARTVLLDYCNENTYINR